MSDRSAVPSTERGDLQDDPARAGRVAGGLESRGTLMLALS